jgi:hypothetical protein
MESKYIMKYAMPVDPKVLEDDFESDERVKDIPRLVELLQSVDEDTYYTVAREVNEIVTELWLYIDSKTGINLRDREKLLPIFQEYSRLSKRIAKAKGTAEVIYRGVYLPERYGDLLSETFGTQTGEIDISGHKGIKTILENLAYGMRSWTYDYKFALSFSQTKRELKDVIVFVLDSNFSRNIVLNGDALIHFIKSDFFMDAQRYDFKYPHVPVDPNEYIVYLKNPKIKSVTRKLSMGQYIWEVKIK